MSSCLVLLNSITTGTNNTLDICKERRKDFLKVFNRNYNVLGDKYLNIYLLKYDPAPIDDNLNISLIN